MDIESVQAQVQELIDRDVPKDCKRGMNIYVHDWKSMAVATTHLAMFGRVCEYCGIVDYTEIIVDAIDGDVIELPGGRTPSSTSPGTGEGCSSQSVRVYERAT